MTLPSSFAVDQERLAALIEEARRADEQSDPAVDVEGGMLTHEEMIGYAVGLEMALRILGLTSP